MQFNGVPMHIALETIPKLISALIAKYEAQIMTKAIKKKFIDLTTKCKTLTMFNFFVSKL